MATPQSTGVDLEKYWRTGKFKSSARLHLQHFLFQSTIGFLVHPQILESWASSNVEPKTLRVADLGCGNARWLIDFYQSCKESSIAHLQLHGIDINPANFPPAFTLPKCMKLEKMDIMVEDIPDELTGTFDVVHIRALASVIHGNDPSIVIKNATKLLKPGGWLQWEETTPDGLVAVTADETVLKPTCSTIIQVLEQGAKMQNLDYSWMYQLDSLFQKEGLEGTDIHRLPMKLEDYKAWTENYLLVWEDIAQMLPTKEAAPQAAMNREIWQGLFLKAVEETDNGVVLHQGQMIVALGQRPV